MNTYEPQLDGVTAGEVYPENILVEHLAAIITQNRDLLDAILSAAPKATGQSDGMGARACHWECLVAAQCIALGATHSSDSSAQGQTIKLNLIGIAARLPLDPSELLFWLADLLYDNRAAIYQRLKHDKTNAVTAARLTETICLAEYILDYKGVPTDLPRSKNHNSEARRVANRYGTVANRTYSRCLADERLMRKPLAAAT